MHKRIFDIIFSVLVLIFLSPMLILVSFLIKLFQGGSIFFYQNRLGLNCCQFKIIKFTSMNNKKDYNGKLLPDKFRLTKIGSIIRNTSVDEIPGFINVIKGNMSVVGPRPLPVHYKDRFSSLQNRRHEVKPGITGWAQINGRNSISWEEKFTLDVWYVENQSFLLDLKIIFLTVFKVFKRENINPDDKDFMDEFLGN